jgi:hypothetical protein
VVQDPSLEKMRPRCVCVVTFLMGTLEYADVIWDNCPNYIKEKLEHINYEAARIISGATKLTSIRILLQECRWETLEERRDKHKILLFHKMVNKTVPEYLSNLVPSSFGQTHQYSTRNHSNLVHVHSRTAYLVKLYVYLSIL